MDSLVSHKIDHFSPMPITANFAGFHEFSKLKLFGFGNGITKTDEPRPLEAAAANSSSKGIMTKAVRYRECHRNHAVSSGGQAVDGCGEFMPSGEEGTLQALKCAACSCHRNFHRREVEGEVRCETCKNIIRDDDPRRRELMAPGSIAPAPQQAGGSQALPHHPQAHFLSRIPSSAPFLLGPGPADSDDGEGGLSGSPSTIKKRFRTKFTTEQKERMAAFADRLGWKMQKHDEGAVQEFCAEVGVKRHVLKVWMHNNKNTIGKKPAVE